MLCPHFTNLPQPVLAVTQERGNLLSRLRMEISSASSRHVGLNASSLPSTPLPSQAAQWWPLEATQRPALMDTNLWLLDEFPEHLTGSEIWAQPPIVGDTEWLSPCLQGACSPVRKADGHNIQHAHKQQMATQKRCELGRGTCAEKRIHLRALSANTGDRAWTGPSFNPVLEVVSRVFTNSPYLSV